MEPYIKGKYFAKFIAVVRLQSISGSIHNETKQIVAIKQIDLEDSDDDIGEIQQEIAHLAQCDSEYVTRYYGSFVKGYKLWISSLFCFIISGFIEHDVWQSWSILQVDPALTS